METGLEKEQLTSNYFKTIIGNDLLHKNYLAVVTEGFNSSDIYGVRRTLYTVEIEIKVSKSDLRGELVSVALCRNRLTDQEYTGKPKPSKYHKHKEYLIGTIWGYEDVPNEFYFAVPDFLVDETIRGVEGTPYGVISIGTYFYHGSYPDGKTWTNKLWGVHYAKKAKKIHNNKLIDKRIYTLINKLTWDNFNLREKLEAL